MKTTKILLRGAILFSIALLGLSSCSKDDTKPTPLHKQYTISPYDQSGPISGSVNFKEILNTDSVKVTIQLTGVSQDGSYPVYLRKGTSIENGPVAFDLGFVDGRNPTLDTTLPISFSNLIKFNGCLDIYRNPNDTVTIVAQSEIGSNEVFKSYILVSPNVSGNPQNGQLRIYKRTNGAYMVIRVDSSAFLTTEAHPARVYKADGITKEFDLSDLSPAGVSATPVTDHTYDDLTKTKRIVRIFQSLTALDVTISEGTIQ